LLFINASIISGQKSEVNIKGIIIPWFTALHYSIGFEISIKNKWSSQATFNFLEIYYDNGDINRRNALMQEFRFYRINPKIYGVIRLETINILKPREFI
jgi:hypothetical protein